MEPISPEERVKLVFRVGEDIVVEYEGLLVKRYFREPSLVITDDTLKEEHRIWELHQLLWPTRA